MSLPSRLLPMPCKWILFPQDDHIREAYYLDIEGVGTFLAVIYPNHWHCCWLPGSGFPPSREHLHKMIRKGWIVPMPMAFSLFRSVVGSTPYEFAEYPEWVGALRDPIVVHLDPKTSFALLPAAAPVPVPISDPDKYPE